MIKMMATIIILNLNFCVTSHATKCKIFLESYRPYSNVNDNRAVFSETLARLLYPEGDKETIALTASFFQVLTNHKTNDPFLGMKGPSGIEYALNKNKFAFIINDFDELADLAIFNWGSEPANGFEIASELSEVYGSTVYFFKGLRQQNIITSPALNFSYILGSDYIESQLLNSGMDVVTESFKDFKPHPNYLEKTHRLREAIGDGSMPLFSPKREYIFNIVPPEVKASFEEALLAQGGLIYKILGMWLHETYHVVEGEAGVKREIPTRVIPEDDAKALNLLENSKEVQILVNTYIKIIFSLAEHLTNENITETDLVMLRDLKLIIDLLKSNYPEVWNIIWTYEYTEGFAEYVSSESLISAGLISLLDNVRFEKADGNSFPYRTGTFAGHFMRFKLRKMLFNNLQDHFFSPWELIIKDLVSTGAITPLNGIIKKYNGYLTDANLEIDKLIEYLNTR